MFNRAFLFAGIFLGLAACVEAQDVYSTGVQIINPGFVLTNPEVWGYLGPNFSVAGGYALMSIDPNLNLRYMGSSLGQIGVFCKIVNPGDVVNTGWIASNLPTGFPFQMTLNQPFLLGFELGSTHLIVRATAILRWTDLAGRSWSTPPPVSLCSTANWHTTGLGLSPGPPRLFPNHHRRAFCFRESLR